MTIEFFSTTGYWILGMLMWDVRNGESLLQQMTAKRNDPMTGVSPNDLMTAELDTGLGPCNHQVNMVTWPNRFHEVIHGC